MMDTGWQLSIYIFAACGIITMAIRYHHVKTVEEKIEDIGGVLASCDYHRRFFSNGPFGMALNGFQYVYYFEYTLDGNDKHGWVMFSLLSGCDWRFNTHKKD